MSLQPHGVRSVSLSVAMLTACAAPRKPVPVVDLRSAGDTLVAPYVEVPEAAWLSEGRWVFVAPGERVVEVADFGSRKLLPMGGVNSGEYRQPFSLFRAGDSIYVGDWGMQRLTVWTLGGKLVHGIPASSALHGLLPKARDGEGQFYLEQRPPAGADGSGNRDSSAILRAPPSLSRADTVAQLAPLDIAEVTGDAGRRFERRILSGNDRWGVLPDGTLWVARVFENRVDWMARSGKGSRGEALPDRVLTVTEADRELFLRRFPDELRGPAEKLPFAIVKPPFENALSAPDGLVWLEKSRAIGDTLRYYQLVDRTGHRVREMRHPGNGHLLALGPSAALIAEQTGTAVRLMQYPIP